jgi:hypothetical protein
VHRRCTGNLRFGVAALAIDRVATALGAPLIGSGCRGFLIERCFSRAHRRYRFGSHAKSQSKRIKLARQQFGTRSRW